MSYEIDFLPVGEGASSGDAIAIRYGNLQGSRYEQTVIVIDGGTKDSGQKLVEHIQEYYGTDVVDLVVCTHPDSDHSSGLSVVMEELDVKALWMHRPWKHGGKIQDAFADNDITNDELSERLQDALIHACALEKIALTKGIPITEPFSDGVASTQFAELTVLGPSTEYYHELLPGFGCLQDAGMAKSIFGRMAEVVKMAWESFTQETLTEPTEETRAENNSSAILLLQVDGRSLLFTGDAGVPALDHAANFADGLGVNLQGCSLQQIPHHGSRRNVGPSILNRIVGPIGAESNSKTVVVSAGKDGAPKHPAKKVTNAYQRRGCKVLGTQGKTVCCSHDAPGRPGWVTATTIPLYTEVEE